MVRQDPTCSEADEDEDEIREEFLDWLSAHTTPAPPKIRVSRSPELADFLSWLAEGRPTRY